METNSDNPKSSAGSGGASPRDNAERAAAAAGENIRQGAERAGQQAQAQAESLKSAAGRQAHQAESALDAVADTLAAHDQESLAKIVSDMARRLDGLATRIEQRSVDDLLHDTGRLAQQNPALFVAGSVAAGVMLSRFFKARSSSSGAHDEDPAEAVGEPARAHDDRSGHDASMPAGRAASSLGTDSDAEHTLEDTRNLSSGADEPRHRPGTPLRAGEAKPDAQQSRSKRGGHRP